MAEKYLVTGGLGFIGAAVTRSLVLDGAEVRVLDNSFRGARERLGDLVDNVEICEGDIRDPRFVDQAVAGVDAVCHLAYINGTSYFYERPQLVSDLAGLRPLTDSDSGTSRRERQSAAGNGRRQHRSALRTAVRTDRQPSHLKLPCGIASSSDRNPRNERATRVPP